MANVVRLKYYDESQYYNGEYHGDPVREIFAGVVYYDDNLTMAENAQRAYLTGTAGCQNFVTHTQVEPPSATTPQVWKREYCETLTFGPAYARFCEELRYLQYPDLTEHFARVLAVNGGWSSSGVGQFMHVYDNSGTAYGIHYQSGSTYPLFTIDPTIISQYHPPYPGYSYIKLLVSRNGGANIVRAIIHGAEMYNHPSPELPDGGRIRREVYTYDLRTYGVSVIVEDIPDPPEPEDEMKIKTPKLVELFNRQYLCTKTQISALAQYIANYPNHQDLIDKIQILLGIDFSDWLSSVVDLQIFPLNLTSHVSHGSQAVQKVRFSPVAFGDDVTGQYIQFSPGVYKVTERDCLFDATRWIPVTRRFDDFRDYPPYCSSQIYLPFIGIVDVDLSLYYGKYMKIKYSVDISSGGCRAFICVADTGSASEDGHIIGQYDGAMGVHCPITKLEWSDYYNSIASGYAATVSSAISAGTSLAGTTGMNNQIKNKNIDYIARKTGQGKEVSQGGLQQYQSYDVSSVLAPFQMGRELNVAESRIPAMTTGSSSGYLNECCDYNCYMFWYYVDTEETANLQALKGYVSDKSGTLNEFTGYLECSDVKLVCPSATENEKTRLVQLLTSGIYI